MSSNLAKIPSRWITPLFTQMHRDAKLSWLMNLHKLAFNPNHTREIVWRFSRASQGSLNTRFFSTQQFPFNEQLLFHHLPVMDVLIKAGLAQEKQPLKNTVVICIQHSLETYLNVLGSLICLGTNPKNIFVLGKHYSECQSVVERIRKLGVCYHPCSEQVGLGKFSQSFIRDINWLWHEVVSQIKKRGDIRNVLILDHGGHALAYVPAEIVNNYKVVGIEKTTGGLIHLDTQGTPPFPLIGVANCAAKRVLESPLIAEAVVAKLLPFIPIKSKKLTCGVVGYGAIGAAIATKLLSLGHKVIVHDNDPQQLQTAKKTPGLSLTDTLSALIANSQYIFSCTGHDISKTVDLFKLSTQDKTLISCSSEDKEYLTLLQHIQRALNGKVATTPLADIVYKTNMDAEIRILRGGFPINFNNTGESVPANDIQLTRSLVLGGVLQAIIFFNNIHQFDPVLYQLDPRVQEVVVRLWLKYQPHDRFPKEVIDQFQNLQWITEHSGGESCRVFDENFFAQSEQTVTLANK